MALAVTMTAYDMPDEQDSRSAMADTDDLLDDGRMGASRSQAAQSRTRSCILTRAVLPESELLRFVVGPDGAVVPDL
ncbi:MAG: YlxR family protein, partial [Pseudomonadota bacterium]